MQEQALAWRAAGLSIGFVATMGALHAGHESLVARARRETDRVIVSVFVNPLQFGPHEDFARYPRAFERDLESLGRHQVDAVFHPSEEEMYRQPFHSRVDPGPPGLVLEGRSRPGHFTGVLTVVCKLFALTQPARAYFGQKDVQQLILVRQMVRDLALPLEVVACATVREPDGLAMSSRNTYLAAPERQAAPAVFEALRAGRQAFDRGEREPAAIEAAAQRRLSAVRELAADYLTLFDAATLAGPPRAAEGNVLATAVKLGSTRLIDNVVLGAETL